MVLYYDLFLPKKSANKKFREYLDIGAITEEEFQMKKNKLMKEI